MAKAKARSNDSPLADQPWWVRSVVWVGVPTAAAAYLLWFVVGGLTTRLDHQSASFEQHQKDMSALIGHLQNETEQSWVVIGTLARICLNTAKTDADKMACATVPRRQP